MTTAELAKYLKENPKYFLTEEAPVLTIDDVIYWKMKKAENIIYPGEKFLCDIVTNELWIVELTDKPDPERHGAYRIKALEMVVDNCQKYFSRFNGYWAIPKGFLHLNSQT